MGSSGNLPTLGSSPFEQQPAQAYSPANDAVRGMKVVVVGGGNGGECHLAKDHPRRGGRRLPPPPPPF